MNTFTIKTPKGRECRIGIRKEYDHVELCLKRSKLLGAKWYIVWKSINGYFCHREEWNDFLDDRTPESVVDEMFDKYGKGKIWGFYEEIAVRA